MIFGDHNGQLEAYSVDLSETLDHHPPNGWVSIGEGENRAQGFDVERVNFAATARLSMVCQVNDNFDVSISGGSKQECANPTTAGEVDLQIGETFGVGKWQRMSGGLLTHSQNMPDAGVGE
jgi:hypothetical protein